MKIAIIYNKDITGVINSFGMQNKEFYPEETVFMVASALEKGGHNVRVLDGNMYVVERLQNFFPKVMDGEQLGMVFNMAYGIQGESRYTHIPSLLEMLGIPYVGSTPSGHALALDKIMTKIIWQNHNLPTPDFWAFNNGEEDMSQVKFPVIVKPKMESVSFGLKIVYHIDELKDAVNFIVTEFQQQALVEQFIPGREFCVGLLGNSPVETFPILEIDLKGDPNAIQSLEDKKQHPRSKICPSILAPHLEEKMRRFSIEAFHALGLRDFARVDIRLDENNNIYLLEINSMASLGVTGSYPTAAQVAGYDFPKLVNKMLDVATVRYFAPNLTIDNQSNSDKLPLHNRMRAFLRGRQQQAEKLLEKIVSTNTHVRNVDGINQCTLLLKAELIQLGFTSEIFPQLEVGNMHYFTNSDHNNLDYLLLVSIDDHLQMHEQELFRESEHRLYGTGIWENKGGIVTAIMALQALRFSKLIKKANIGILLITDSSINGKFSKGVINQKALNAKHVISLHGANLDGSVVTSRSGSALYHYNLRLTDHSTAENVSEVSHFFYKSLAAVTEPLSKNNTCLVAPYKTEFTSNIFKTEAHGNSMISVRYNSEDDFTEIDKRIRKLTSVPKKLKNKVIVHFDGGISRAPYMPEATNEKFFNTIKTLGKALDIQIVKEHRWSSSDICNVPAYIASIDGVGPIGGYDNQKSEFILRHSLVDRALLLAMIISNEL